MVSWLPVVVIDESVAVKSKVPVGVLLGTVQVIGAITLLASAYTVHGVPTPPPAGPMKTWVPTPVAAGQPPPDTVPPRETVVGDTLMVALYTVNAMLALFESPSPLAGEGRGGGYA